MILSKPLFTLFPQAKPAEARCAKALEGCRAKGSTHRFFKWNGSVGLGLNFTSRPESIRPLEINPLARRDMGNNERNFEIVEAVVEIPRGSRNKYELDHHSGMIFLDRVLFSSVHYPTDYGFITGTRAADGDPLDVLVIVEEPTFPGCRVKIRPIGVLLMRDEKGIDEKILAVPVADPRFDGIRDIKDLQKHWLVEIENFFSMYKELERGKQTHVEGWKNAEEAKAVLSKYWTPSE